MVMFLTSQIDRLEGFFLAQFEEDGDRCLYRKHGRGAPIPVTPQEKEDFRLQYRRATRSMFWLTIALTIVAIALAFWITPEFLDEGPGIFVISMATILAIAVLSVRNTTAPARTLGTRLSIGPPLTNREVRAKHFASTSWALLGSIFFISTTVCGYLLWSAQFTAIEDYFWAAGSAMIAVIGARALWLKYSLGV
ncbi:hypothetical protein [Qipengyuania qiaonensis]|uniref:DUF2178 domain-containing protein n=1 Tax=Qipengyuania qiaonensis TaxID=2867240 RepID=A0ABS7J4C0_9SPHN|nr:hypothetical protein [Qipengyuania qiaonensis]MBX7482186.1 hypothetical protein [Qipengyuania qiaonensis]